MADKKVFDKQEMLKNLAIEALDELLDSFTLTYPYLDYTSIHSYDEKEISGSPMLFELHDYYFVGYFINSKSDMEVAVTRSMIGDDFKYHDCFREIPPYAHALSLSSTKTYSSVLDITQCLSTLPFGSFIQITDVNGIQSIGFFQGFSSGNIRLAFGYDLDAGIYENTQKFSLYKRENLHNYYSFPEKKYCVTLCKKIQLLETKEGISSASLILTHEQHSKISSETTDEIMNLLSTRRSSEIIVSFDCIRGRVLHSINKKITQVSTFPGAISGSILCRFKILASLDQAERDETQRGSFAYSLSDEEQKIQIEITYPEPGCYSISLIADFGLPTKIDTYSEL